MELQNNLPPGWDTKVDKKTGKMFYINHYTRTTSWEDPRPKNIVGTKQSPYHMQHLSSNDHVSAQHGSPELRRNYVYPSQSSPIPAFQIPGQHSPKYIPLQDAKTNARMSPVLFKASQTQESSIANIPDTEESVNKISAMFPTVSETHIRLLLKKYHGREAVVISALQVEKHPITTPGPFTTPPPSRNKYPGLHSSLQMTPPLGFRSYSRGVSPVTRFGSIITDSTRTGDNFRNSSRPHSSPKLKLRYMKSIFPKAEETVILDVLTSSDNNIQKASEWLKKMGYDRKDPIKLQQHIDTNLEEKQKTEAQIKAEVQVPKIKTTDEKVAITKRLQDRYTDIIEQVIMIALDSVQYDEERASKILEIMVREEYKAQSSTSSKIEEHEVLAHTSTNINLAPGTISTSQSRQSFKNIAGSDKTEDEHRNCDREHSESNPTFKSPLLTTTQGANPDIVKGADDKLLLADYVLLEGANPNLRNGPQKDLAGGPNKNNLCERKCNPVGPNPQLCKGAKPGLAKGSIFQHLRNIVNNESRGK